MKRALLIAFCCLALSESRAENADRFPVYQPAKLEGETLTSVGSDSMGSLMSVLVDRYNVLQPGVTVQVTSGGSAAAPAALVDGSADIGPMARPMRESEVEEFRGRFGFAPTSIRVAIAPIAIYVNADNPISKISLQELDTVFSTQRKQGLNKDILLWSDLGVSGDWAERGIIPLGADPSSVASIFFKQQVMLQGEFRPNVQTAAGANALFEMLKLNPGAIGFGELTTPPAGIKLIAVSDKDKGPVLPAGGNIVSATYPLSRYLNLYFVRYPFNDPDLATKDFISFVLSREGQSIIKAQGLMPLPTSVLNEELTKLN